MLYLGLWAGMLKNYCHICDQRLLIYRIAKFRSKIRIFKFGTKNALFGCFGQQFQKTIVIFEISALQFTLLQSLMQKIKALKFGTKNARFAYIGTGIWRYYCHIWNQHPGISLTTKFRETMKKHKFEKKTMSFAHQSLPTTHKLWDLGRLIFQKN